MSQELFYVNGLGIGEETKGAAVQWLVKRLNSHLVIRSGGCQGGTQIISEDGREQQFSHFGAGTFEGAKTHLLNMVINPVDLFTEAIELESKNVNNPLDLISIDGECISLTPYHSAISRFREIMRDKKKGTVGKGVGDAVLDSFNPELTIRAREFAGDRGVLLSKVENIRIHKLQQAEEIMREKNIPDDAKAELNILHDSSLVGLTVESFRAIADLVKIVDKGYLDELLTTNNPIVGEVTHGALLHPRYGFVPHVTQIDPTGLDAINTIRTRDYKGKVIRIGATRCYMTRHGAGPLVSFNRNLNESIHETVNNMPQDNKWIGDFRNGSYDLIALKYAVAISGGKESYDGLIVSYLDELLKRNEWPICVAYEYKGDHSELRKYFDLNKDGLITGIKVYTGSNNNEQLIHQKGLTELLEKCSPVEINLSPSISKSLEENFIDFVERNIEIPVVALAHGPKISDRKARPGYEFLFD